MHSSTQRTSLLDMSIAIAASLTATAALFAATPGVATAQTASRAIAVAFSDLDLATPQGQRQLDRRIRQAARSVCGSDDVTTGTRMASAEAGSCYSQALRDVRQRVAAAIEASGRGG